MKVRFERTEPIEILCRDGHTYICTGKQSVPRNADNAPIGNVEMLPETVTIATEMELRGSLHD